MSVLYSVGYAYGVAAVAMAPVALVVLLVPFLRRRLVTGPLRRLLARHRAADTMRITMPYTRSYTRPPE